MKTIFIEARCKKKINLDSLQKNINKLPNKIGLVTTVQHIHEVDRLKDFFQKNKKQIITAKGKKTKYQAQVLGCDADAALSIKNKVDAFLYIGSGVFHPMMMQLKTDKDVFQHNPLTDEFRKLDKTDSDKIRKKQKGALIKFYSSKNIGVLISIKPGQQHLGEALNLEKKYPDKNFYFMVSNTLDFSQLENFPFIECFVNTACPRIAYDDAEKIRKPIINAEDIR